MIEEQKSKTRFSDKKRLLEIMKRWHQENHIPYDANAMPEQSKQRLLAAGIKPELNEFSSMIIRERYSDDEA